VPNVVALCMEKIVGEGEFSGFEKEYERLGEIVSRLEDGNIPLETMLSLYEEGSALATKLTTMLKTAELRVERLAKAHEELVNAVTEPIK
jgi:exodeoxyribonuclease VII small subunit